MNLPSFRSRRRGGALLSCLVFAGALVAPLTAADPAPTPPPLPLDDAIRLALEKNPQIKVQEFGRSIARADWLTAMGAFDPALTFRRSYSEDNAAGYYGNAAEIRLRTTRTDNYSLTLEGLTPWGLRYSIGSTAQNPRYPDAYQDNFYSSAGVSVTQPLLRGFGFGANLLGVRIAKANRGIADSQFRQAAIDTVTSVINAYSELAYAQQALRIAQRSRELASGLVTENERRFKVGSMSENDVIQARARTATRDEGVLYAEQGVRDATNRLRQLIGEREFQIAPRTLPIDTELALTETPVDLQLDLKQAYDNRPDYQQARLTIQKARANRSAARNALLPEVDFVGTYGYNGLDANFAASRRAVENYENRNYSAGVVVRVPITFAEGRGRARSAKLSLRQAEADLIRLEQDIAVSIASAAGQIETTRKRVAANRAAYELARQALDDELKKLRAGTSNTFFVLQLQGELAGVENSLYRSIADQRRAQANYDRELGRTLAVHNITLQKQ
jgi:outer membrane protein TolC